MMVEMAEKVLKKLNIEVEGEGLKLSTTEEGKEGQIKAITSCRYPEERLQECSRKKVALAAGDEGEGEKREV